MGFRFRRSIKIMPGLRLNVGKRGSSISIGGKGFTHNIGTRGSRTTVSLPGTGLSYTAHGSKPKRRAKAASAPAPDPVIAPPSLPNDPSRGSGSKAGWILFGFVVLVIVIVAA